MVRFVFGMTRLRGRESMFHWLCDWYRLPSAGRLLACMEQDGVLQQCVTRLTYEQHRRLCRKVRTRHEVLIRRRTAYRVNAVDPYAPKAMRLDHEERELESLCLQLERLLERRRVRHTTEDKGAPAE